MNNTTHNGTKIVTIVSRNRGTRYLPAYVAAATYTQSGYQITKDHVAKIGTKGYATKQDAVAAAIKFVTKQGIVNGAEVK